MNTVNVKSNSFIHQHIEKDLISGKCTSVHTRFPPEPNGYLHLGHAKSICLNFGIAIDYNGQCNLRFDDTNPVKNNIEYVEAIKNDIQWLGFNWSGCVRYSSDYFDKLYNYALELIGKGLAYVDELSVNAIKEYRGTLTSVGENSPYRDRSIKENLVLFTKMRNGEFAEGSACLRAKIDMSSPLIIMRDPVLYRIKFTKFNQKNDAWYIYPMYDFAHCISDALEGITHSLCTLEFLDNRQLYDWILNNISIDVHPHQYEFSRLNLEYTIMSKRKLNLLIKHKIVESWDDPRLPTISGLRRRGYTATSIREFCRRIGVTKQESNIEISVLESCIREELNKNAPRAMAVLNPVKLIINNLPEEYEENITMFNHPNKPEMGTRQVIFSREIFIDYSDFLERANPQYKRLVLGQKVRLRNAYIIKAEGIKKDQNGLITAIFCSYDSNTLNKHPCDGSKVRGVIHWVSAKYNIPAAFYLYDKLFKKSNLSAVVNFMNVINPKSLIICYGFVESSLLKSKIGEHYQFEREGYFCADNHCFNSSRLVFNRTVSLRNTYSKSFEVNL